MTTHTEAAARQAGTRDARAGKRYTECPYRFDSPLALIWLHAWQSECRSLDALERSDCSKYRTNALTPHL